jgi:hypothetical protein
MNNGGESEMNAILTPSTKGLRASLTEEDINFEMPLNNSNNSKQQQRKSFDNNSSNNIDESPSQSIIIDEVYYEEKQTCKPQKEKEEQEEEEGEEDEEDDSDEPSEWLEQIGLNSTVNFKASVLQRNSANLRNNTTQTYDNTSRSTLFLREASDVQVCNLF